MQGCLTLGGEPSSNREGRKDGDPYLWLGKIAQNGHRQLQRREREFISVMTIGGVSDRWLGRERMKEREGKKREIERGERER